MDDLIIERSKKEFYTFPEINFNASTGVCQIEGESFMENAREFYQPVFDWLDEFYKKKPGVNIIFDLSLSYYNTSSSKALYMLFHKLKEFKNAGRHIEINWKYKVSDREMEDDITDLQIETGLEINMIGE